MSTILFPKRLKKLVHYIGMTEDVFKKEMMEHYENNGDDRNSARTAVDRLFKTGNPHRKTVDKVTLYFSRKCRELEKKFDPVWLQKSFADFKKIDELRNIKPSSNKTHSPYTIFKPYQDYVDEKSNVLKGLIEGRDRESLCRDYMIYRYHSDGKRIVRDVLRIISYENGTALCDLFLYCDEPDHIFDEYKCNMFIDNNVAFYLIATCPAKHDSSCPYFVLFTFSGDLIHNENLGVVSGVPDEGDNPISACVLLTANCKNRLDPNDEVTEINPEEIQEQTIRFKKFSIYPNPVININMMVDFELPLR